MANDIVDDLEADGRPLSRRAARYIKIKRAWISLLEAERHTSDVFRCTLCNDKGRFWTGVDGVGVKCTCGQPEQSCTK